MAGVKLRVNGGVGSDYNFTLNVFSGRQVKFFMDGLAMDNFSDAFSINNLPANMVERVELETGFVNRPFADYLLAGIIVARNDKDIQNGVVMDLVYGARTTDSRSVIPMLRYKKSDLFIEGLGLSFYGSYSDVDNNSTDTVPRRYNWQGEWVPNASTSSGERSRSQLHINNKEWRTNTSLNYTFNQYHTLSLNHVYSGLTRKVSDVEDPANEYNKVPQSIDKQYLIWDGWPNIHDGMLPCSKGDKACE